MCVTYKHCVYMKISLSSTLKSGFALKTPTQLMWMPSLLGNGSTLSSHVKEGMIIESLHFVLSCNGKVKSWLIVRRQMSYLPGHPGWDILIKDFDSIFSLQGRV